MFVTNWISTTKIQKISEITNFFRHYFLSRTEVNLLFFSKNRCKGNKKKILGLRKSPDASRTRASSSFYNKNETIIFARKRLLFKRTVELAYLSRVQCLYLP